MSGRTSLEDGCSKNCARGGVRDGNDAPRPAEGEADIGNLPHLAATGGMGEEKDQNLTHPNSIMYDQLSSPPVSCRAASSGLAMAPTRDSDRLSLTAQSTIRLYSSA